MKKKRSTLYPADEFLMKLIEKGPQTTPMEIIPGKTYRIGPPSAIYYISINTVPVFDNGILLKRESFSALQGVKVRVNSVLKMKNGNNIAVLRHHNGSLFLGLYEKFYVFVKNALNSNEILPLEDSEN